MTGAGGGIGSALALNLARRGCHLALSDRNPDLLAKTPRPLVPGVNVSEHVFDIADPAAIAAFPAGGQSPTWPHHRSYQLRRRRA